MDNQDRVPLAQVVSELVKVWFQDALNEAKAGDTNMQILVGQMYCNGYGVHKDVQKFSSFMYGEHFHSGIMKSVLANRVRFRNQGHAWIGKASRNRSSAWKVSDKHPGYNASDSDSDEPKGDAK
ncbi:hypothetical protein V6N12_032376 [Hibiscus sabdariffa]|uniref:Uncharacterized protein n=1 Tax=Hibiscus sabdariffa TaxID=183260 RepID=A0ABR2CCV9_9ROSI